MVNNNPLGNGNSAYHFNKGAQNALSDMLNSDSLMPFELSADEIQHYRQGLQDLGLLAQYAVRPGTPIQVEDKTYYTIQLRLPFELLESHTLVNPEINPRDQDGLSLELLAHITGDWSGENRIVAQGRFHNGKIEVLAGSCRRFVAIQLKGHWLVDVAFEMSDVHARNQAKTSDQSMSLSAYEIGQQALLMEEKDQIQRQKIAQRLGKDEGSLSKIMNAVDTLNYVDAGDNQLKVYFGSYRTIGVNSLYQIYKALDKIKNDKRLMTKFFRELENTTRHEAYSALTGDKRSAALFKLINNASQVAQGKAKPVKAPVVKTHLWGDPEHKSAALWSELDPDKRSYTIKSARLTQIQIAKIADAISLVIDDLDSH